MNLDEAIEHAKEVACSCKNKECAADHRQLANWLRELKEYRAAEQDLDSKPVKSMAMYRLHVASYRMRIKKLNAVIERMSNENAKMKEALYET